MNFSIYDTRPLPEREDDLRALDAIQAILEDSIADYALRTLRISMTRTIRRYCGNLYLPKG